MNAKHEDTKTEEYRQTKVVTKSDNTTYQQPGGRLRHLKGVVGDVSILAVFVNLGGLRGCRSTSSAEERLRHEEHLESVEGAEHEDDGVCILTLPRS